MPWPCVLEPGADHWFDIGAMHWRNHGYQPYDMERRPMPHLAVITPGGLWCIDCPSSDPPHGHWTRTGDPPSVTVTPSIVVGDPVTYHGFLTNGVLTDDLEGRVYPPPITEEAPMEQTPSTDEGVSAAEADGTDLAMGGLVGVPYADPEADLFDAPPPGGDIYPAPDEPGPAEPPRGAQMDGAPGAVGVYEPRPGQPAQPVGLPPRAGEEPQP